MPFEISPVILAYPGLLSPNCIAYHPSGLWVVSDAGNDRLVLLNENLSINRTLEGVLSRPRGVAVDAEGRIWVSDGGNDRIVVLGPDLSVLHTFGSAGAGPGEFALPWGIAVDRFGRIAVADALNRRIQILGPDLELQRTIGSWGTGAGEFDGPLDLCFDSAGRLFVVDTYLEAEGYVRRVQVFNADLSFNRTIWDVDSRLRFTRPVGVGISANGLVGVADFLANRIYFFDSSGDHLGGFSWVAGQPTLESPYDIAFCELAYGGLLAGIVERDSNRVRVVKIAMPEAHLIPVLLAFWAFFAKWRSGDERLPRQFPGTLCGPVRPRPPGIRRNAVQAVLSLRAR